MGSGTSLRCRSCRIALAKPCKDCGAELTSGAKVYCLKCMAERGSANRHGLTVEQYRELLQVQGGLCAICHEPETRQTNGRPWSLAVDHDHGCCPGETSCGSCVRGLLCGKCNGALGWVGDEVDRLMSAVSYLQLYQANLVNSFPGVVQADT